MDEVDQAKQAILRPPSRAASGPVPVDEGARRLPAEPGPIEEITATGSGNETRRLDKEQLHVRRRRRFLLRELAPGIRAV